MAKYLKFRKIRILCIIFNITRGFLLFCVSTLNNFAEFNFTWTASKMFKTLENSKTHRKCEPNIVY